MRGKARYTWLGGATSLLVATICCGPADTVDPRTFIVDARVIDGTGGPSRQVDVRIDGDRIGAVGDLQPQGRDIVVGQDGGQRYPLADFFTRLEEAPTASATPTRTRSSAPS